MYKTCGPFMENEERLQKFKEIGGIWYIFLNELDKVCFQHDLANDYSRDVPRRSPRSPWNLHQWSTNSLIKNLQDLCGFTSVIYKFFDKKSKGTTNHVEVGISNVILNISNYLVN